jgi:hypothetical protein
MARELLIDQSVEETIVQNQVGVPTELDPHSSQLLSLSDYRLYKSITIASIHESSD